jgi:uncharacterized membrane protein YcaP (DUF421 family)
MNIFTGINWHDIFFSTTPILEIFIRGTIVYLGLFLLLRLVLKRESGAVGITDLLVVVLIADAAQNAMAGSYKSIPDGLLLVGTIVFWSYFLNWLGYRFPRFHRFVHPPPLLLVKEGNMLRQNMRRELITEEELLSMLRQQGVEDLSIVKKAFMEGDGTISIINKEEPGANGKPKKKDL